jgi:acetylornithine deacetylase/succinyl-diaminopimelate desuccinylase-like protein
MGTRRDAIAGASEIATAVESLGNEAATAGNIVATVTEFEAHDTASNKICGRVSLTIDLRSIDQSYRDQVEEELVGTIQSIAAERDLEVDLEPYYRQDPVPLEEWVIDGLEEHAEAIGTTYERLPSGGGHDGRHLQSVGIPSGMLFVPSINGVSHSPDEETVPGAVVDAAAVFARAIITGL